MATAPASAAQSIGWLIVMRAAQGTAAAALGSILGGALTSISWGWCSSSMCR